MNGPFDACIFAAVLDALFGDRGSKALAVAEKVDGLEQIRLALAIAPDEQIDPAGKHDLLSVKIAVPVHAKPGQFHDVRPNPFSRLGIGSIRRIGLLCWKCGLSLF